MINPLTPGYYYPQQVFQHIYIWSDRRAFSAVKSRTGYSTRMFLASPAKQFLTTSACLPACRPAGHWNFQWSSSVVWFHFVASSMNTPFNTILTSPASEGESTKVNSTCTQHDAHHSSPQASRSRMITVSPFPSVLNPGNQVTPRRDYCYPQKVSAVRLGGIYQLDISQCMTKCKLWRTQWQQQHVEWWFSTLLCLIKCGLLFEVTHCYDVLWGVYINFQPK